MLGRHANLVLVRTLVACAIGACSTALANPVPQTMWRQFGVELDLCTSKTGFDPYKVPDTVGPHDIAPGEREWRSCVYKAIEVVLVPNSRIPNVYKELIERDKGFTEKILKGEATRKDRTDANVSALARIIPQEELLYERELEEQRERLDELRWQEEQQRFEDHIDDLERTVNDLRNSIGS